jgi:hypothetical protein
MYIINVRAGLFVQFMMGCGIFAVGMVVFVLQGFPTFYPLAMVGGLLWATGLCLIFLQIFLM